MAPEISDQYAKGLTNRNSPNTPIPVNVDLFSDAWSVAIGIHQIIFTIHPFSFLKELSKNSFNSLQREKIKLPSIPIAFAFFNKSVKNIRLLRWYQAFFKKAITPNLQGKFRSTFYDGLANPKLRTTYTQWKITLKQALKTKLKR